MNQILLTDNENNKKKNNTNKNNSNYNRNNSNDIKKIITFFAVVILIFGIAIGSIYGYKIYKNNKSEETVIGEPTISLENTEEKVTIIAKSEAGLSKIIYQWNDSEEEEEEVNDRKNQEKRIEIELPTGKNTLRVKIIDQLGQEKETTQEFTKEETTQENSDKIDINLSVIEEENGKKLKISVKSEMPIKYVAYKWNEEDETRVETENEQEQTEMEIKIDVKRGKNKLSVTAEDAEGNTNTKEENYEGKLNPEFEVYREDNKLYMKITHDKGFKKIEFNINGIELVYDETKSIYDASKQEVEFYFDLQEGENLVKINALSNEETSAEYAGKCTL